MTETSPVLPGSARIRTQRFFKHDQGSAGLDDLHRSSGDAGRKGRRGKPIGARASSGASRVEEQEVESRAVGSEAMELGVPEIRGPLGHHQLGNGIGQRSEYQRWDEMAENVSRRDR